MAETINAKSAPWNGAQAVARPTRWRASTLLPLVGPLILFIIWDLVVRVGWIKAILLPAPLDTVITMITGLAGGPLLTDFVVTVIRTPPSASVSCVWLPFASGRHDAANLSRSGGVARPPRPGLSDPAPSRGGR